MEDFPGRGVAKKSRLASGAPVSSAAASASSRTKNPSRAAPDILGPSPIRLGVAGGRFGHMLRPGVFVPEMTASAVLSGPDSEDVMELVDPEEVPGIPVHAGPNVAAGEFYSFATTVPVLFVGGLPPAGPEVAVLVDDGRVTMVVDQCTCVALGGGRGTVFPWAGFDPEFALVLGDPEAAPGVATYLLAKGARVAGASAAEGAPAPQCRVKNQTLKWIKDADFEKEIAGIVDQMGGLYKKRPFVSEDEYACVPWSFVAYDAAFDVPRQLLTWGFFAAWVLKNASPEDIAGCCEPLRSYMLALQRSEDARFEDGAGQGAEIPPLDFNTAVKMTPEQLEHAMRVFYWACLHADDGSRPISKAHARRILDMYLTFGTVLLKKRNYNFQGAGKRRSRKRVGVDADDYDDEE